MLKRALIPFALAAAFLCAPFVARAPSAWADTPTATDAGSGSGSSVDKGSAAAPAPTKADALPNPLQNPVQAISEAKLAQKTAWPLAVWCVLAMLGKALAYGRDKIKGVPLLGKLAAWLAKGKGAMIVAAVGAVGAAGYNVMADGGTLTAAIVAAGIALAGITHSTTKNAPTTGGAAPSTSPS